MIYGERVRLRAIERSDIPTFVRWFNDPEVRRYLLMYTPMSHAQEERWFASTLEQKDDFLFGIEVREADTWVHIGNLGLHRVDWRNRCAVFGIVLGEKAYWGLGYGTDATRAMVRYAFDELNLHRVELETYAFNPRARQCYLKAGFRDEGVRREALYRDGAYHDVHSMAILKPDWKEAQASTAETPG